MTIVPVFTFGKDSRERKKMEEFAQKLTEQSKCIKYEVSDACFDGSTGQAWTTIFAGMTMSAPMSLTSSWPVLMPEDPDTILHGSEEAVQTLATRILKDAERQYLRI